MSSHSETRVTFNTGTSSRTLHCLWYIFCELRQHLNLCKQFRPFLSSLLKMEDPPREPTESLHRSPSQVSLVLQVKELTLVVSIEDVRGDRPGYYYHITLPPRVPTILTTRTSTCLSLRWSGSPPRYI